MRLVLKLNSNSILLTKDFSGILILICIFSLVSLLSNIAYTENQNSNSQQENLQQIKKLSDDSQKSRETIVHELEIINNHIKTKRKILLRELKKLKESKDNARGTEWSTRYAGTVEDAEFLAIDSGVKIGTAKYMKLKATESIKKFDFNFQSSLQEEDSFLVKSNIQLFAIKYIVMIGINLAKYGNARGARSPYEMTSWSEEEYKKLLSEYKLNMYKKIYIRYLEALISADHKNTAENNPEALNEFVEYAKAAMNFGKAADLSNQAETLFVDGMLQLERDFISTVPVVGSVFDAYGALTAEDLWTNKKVSGMQRMVDSACIITPGVFKLLSKTKRFKKLKDSTTAFFNNVANMDDDAIKKLAKATGRDRNAIKTFKQRISELCPGISKTIAKKTLAIIEKLKKVYESGKKLARKIKVSVIELKKTKQAMLETRQKMKTAAKRIENLSAEIKTCKEQLKKARSKNFKKEISLYENEIKQLNKNVLESSDSYASLQKIGQKHLDDYESILKKAPGAEKVAPIIKVLKDKTNLTVEILKAANLDKHSIGSVVRTLEKIDNYLPGPEFELCKKLFSEPFYPKDEPRLDELLLEFSTEDNNLDEFLNKIPKPEFESVGKTKIEGIPIDPEFKPEQKILTKEEILMQKKNKLDNELRILAAMLDASTEKVKNLKKELNNIAKRYDTTLFREQNIIEKAQTDLKNTTDSLRNKELKLETELKNIPVDLKKAETEKRKLKEKQNSIKRDAEKQIDYVLEKSIEYKDASKKVRESGNKSPQEKAEAAKLKEAAKQAYLDAQKVAVMLDKEYENNKNESFKKINRIENRIIDLKKSKISICTKLDSIRKQKKAVVSKNNSIIETARKNINKEKFALINAKEQYDEAVALSQRLSKQYDIKYRKYISNK